MKFVFVCAICVIFPAIALSQENLSFDSSAGVEFKGRQGHRFKVPQDMIEEKHPGLIALIPVDEYIGKKILEYDDRFKRMQEFIDILKNQIIDLQKQVLALQVAQEKPVQNSNQTASPH